MGKYYIYALNVKEWAVTAALACPNETIAQEAFRNACQDLDGYGSSERFDFGIAYVGLDAWIEYKLPDKKGWFWWLRGYWEEGKLYKKDRVDKHEFETAESQTKKTIHAIRFYKDKNYGQDILFMSLVDLALKKPSTTPLHLTNTPLTEPAVSPVDYPFQIQALSGKFVPSIKIDERYRESIEDAEEDGLSPAIKKDLRNVILEAALLQGHADDVDKWHIISRTKYKDKGWRDIARTTLDQEVRDGKRKSFTEKNVKDLARNIQNRVEVYRNNLCLAEN